MSIQEKWNTIYQRHSGESEPASVLANHTALLPAGGLALDLACGLGANALLLAECGLAVDALDISTVAIAHLQASAAARRLVVNAKACELSQASLPASHYDVIVVSRFLDRRLCPAINASLKPGGLLFYQTYTQHKISPSGPNNPDYLLAAGELLTLFTALQVVFYQDYARLGDITRLERNEAQLIAYRR